VALRDAILEPELVEQLPLIPLPPLTKAQTTESLFDGPNKAFIDSIDPNRNKMKAVLTVFKMASE